MHEDKVIEIENRYSKKVNDNPSGQERKWHLMTNAMNYITQGKTWKPRGDTKGGGEMPVKPKETEQKKVDNSGKSHQSWERTESGSFLINNK